MALSEISNGIGEKYEGNGFTFEPGWYTLRPVCDPSKNMDIRIESYLAQDNATGEEYDAYRLSVPFEAVALLLLAAVIGAVALFKGGREQS